MSKKIRKKKALRKEIYSNRIKKGLQAGCGIWLAFCLAACGEPDQNTAEPKEVVRVMPGAYDSIDTALVIKHNQSKKEITFFNLKKKKNYTLNYEGTTNFLDKYETPISAAQLVKGDMVDLRFLKDTKMLSYVKESSEIWEMTKVENFELDLNAGRMKIRDEFYTLGEDTLILSHGEEAEYLDIHPGDSLRIIGKDHEIYSISIEEGHGYLRLENDEYFIGGWIEIGQKMIRKIEEDMLFTVPEGKHRIYVSHTGIEGEKEVEIQRGKETTVDLGDLRKEDLVKYGNLIFTVDPSSASVRVDGKEVDITRTVKAEYGLHQVMVAAEGYETVIQYIRVSKEGASLNITLEKEKEKTLSGNTTSIQNITPTPLPTVSGNSTTPPPTNPSATTSGNTTTASTTGYKVEINAPVGAEVYVDGNYVGIAPTSFKKAKGTYKITLRKKGYASKDYSIVVDDENKDRQYSFSELDSVSANSTNN